MRRFPKHVIDAAWERANRKCEKCSAPIAFGAVNFDHIKPHGLGGESTLENCAALCLNCHSEKTHKEDRPPMQKADNARHKNLYRERKPWPKGRSRWG